MIEFEFNFGSFIGIIDILLSIVMFCVYLIIAIVQRTEIGYQGMILLIVQSCMSILFLLLSGLILLFHGWRLDTILQVSVFLQTLILIYLIVKDMFIFKTIPNSRKD